MHRNATIRQGTRSDRASVIDPTRGTFADVGCGNGVPISRALLSEGHRVVGLDSSSAMLARYKQNCREAFAVRGIVQTCPFADGVFDAAVAWGVMLHLNPAIRAIANISRILKPGAPFLFTSGDEDCFDAKEGTMKGVTFRYFSYSPHSYRRILSDYRFTLLEIHADSGKNTYYLAKTPEPPSGLSKIPTSLKIPWQGFERNRLGNNNKSPEHATNPICGGDVANYDLIAHIS